MSALDGIHIPIPQIWEAVRNQNRFPASLPEAEWCHLKDCDHCINILCLCHTSGSLEQVQLTLKSQQRNHPDSHGGSPKA
jgi:hypothetical protein